MGCFIACLGGSNKRKHLKSSRIQTHPNSHNNHSGVGSYQQLESVSTKLNEGEACSELNVGSRTEKQTLRSVLGARKKVTFNLNVKTYELISSNDYSSECEDNKQESSKNESVGNEGMSKESASAASEYPSNYRYKNFIDFEDDDDEVDEFDDCLEDCLEEEEDDDDDVELYHSVDERFGNVHSVLSPVENTAQWRAVKVKKKKTLLGQSLSKHQCKENVALEEMRVDASLSVWIGGNGHQLNNLIKASTI